MRKQHYSSEQPCCRITLLEGLFASNNLQDSGRHTGVPAGHTKVTCDTSVSTLDFTLIQALPLSYYGCSCIMLGCLQVNTYWISTAYLCSRYFVGCTICVITASTIGFWI
ncbi:hypothetical protein BT96DRAFT_166034 [Gymnopus androsaceus JB14]|uniref:Uncharacterized protein n=1 Tax=Gymnopus androsaceus JB14 TaxID=1447944 RepID=A0A6A4HDA1_9AGAR|nr:hypothetical protein BT96DRAFT_166034 [Gymnopus androsaceus JB14]